MFNASIVLYKQHPAEVAGLVGSLLAAPGVSHVYLVDNSPEQDGRWDKLGAEYLYNKGRNLGYGRAHNIALRRSLEQGVPYHLVVNPDVELSPDVIPALERFMNAHPDVGHVMPRVVYPDGELQYLCKLLPTPADLLVRRFLPAGWTRRRMERFEMRASGYDHVMDVPYLSGCFMFLRTDTLKRVGLFDERYFLYPEDIDLTRRIHAVCRTVYYPGVQVVHHHARGSYRNPKMLAVHLWNMAKYFNKWGWLHDPERKRVNRECGAHHHSQ